MCDLCDCVEDCDSIKYSEVCNKELIEVYLTLLCYTDDPVCKVDLQKVRMELQQRGVTWKDILEEMG